MSEEDTIVNYLIGELETLPNVDYDIEMPYNNYGDRGSVDLVVTSWFKAPDMYKELFRDTYSMLNGGHRKNMPAEYDIILVFEVKSEYAIEQATGANEIIRQFKRHQEHFFKGSEYDRFDAELFVLIFEDTEVIRKHIVKNYNMYVSCGGKVCLATPEHDQMRWQQLPTSIHRDKPEWVLKRE